MGRAYTATGREVAADVGMLKVCGVLWDWAFRIFIANRCFYDAVQLCLCMMVVAGLGNCGRYACAARYAVGLIPDQGIRYKFEVHMGLVGQQLFCSGTMNLTM